MTIDQGKALEKLKEEGYAPVPQEGKVKGGPLIVAKDGEKKVVLPTGEVIDHSELA